MSAPKFESSPDGTLVRVTLGDHELVMNAEEVEHAMATLAAVLSQLQPEVAMERAPLGTFAATNSPLTMLATDFAGDGAIFSIRDPARGWLHYRYFEKDLREMLVLIEQILASHGKRTRQ